MTTDIDIWTQTTAHHQVDTRHTLTPAQVKTINVISMEKMQRQ